MFYLAYAFVSGGIVFGFYRDNLKSPKSNPPVESFWGEGQGVDRVALVEGRYYSGVSRINLMENAQETLDIAYFTVDDGISSDIFFGELLDAADRGVRIRLLLDGIFHNFRGSSKSIMYTLKAHPNIELKLYEPFNLLMPWTWHNRLHDKIIIADRKLGMIGGRNIGDRYFIGEDDGLGDIVNDRDVVVVRTGDLDDSAISDMEGYFDHVWEHKYTKDPIRNLRGYQKTKGEKQGTFLKQYRRDIRENYPEAFNRTMNWEELSVSTKKISLIYNPIERFNKDPLIWRNMAGIAKRAQSTILIQSPYIIPTKEMQKTLSLGDVSSTETTILTNSIGIGVNFPGMGGYMKYRKDIRDNCTHLYEYQGPGSIHGKSYIVDDRLSLVGSFNLDARSTFLSTETMVVIDSEEFAEVLKDTINGLIDSSLLVGEDYNYVDDPEVQEVEPSIIKEFLVGGLYVLTYFFDFLV